MAFKQLVTTVALGAGLGLGVAAPAWAEQPMTDMTATQQEIQNKLSRAESSGDQIEVKIDANGVVKLLGDVDSDGQEKTAVDVAKSVPGVTQVQNDLRVSPTFTP